MRTCALPQSPGFPWSVKWSPGDCSVDNYALVSAFAKVLSVLGGKPCFPCLPGILEDKEKQRQLRANPASVLFVWAYEPPCPGMRTLTKLRKQGLPNPVLVLSAWKQDVLRQRHPILRFAEGSRFEFSQRLSFGTLLNNYRKLQPLSSTHRETLLKALKDNTISIPPEWCRLYGSITTGLPSKAELKQQLGQILYTLDYGSGRSGHIACALPVAPRWDVTSQQAIRCLFEQQKFEAENQIGKSPERFAAAMDNIDWLCKEWASRATLQEE